MHAYDSVEAKNVLVKRSTETVTWAVELSTMLESGETVISVTSASIIKSGGAASIAGGPTLSGTQISVVVTGGSDGDSSYKILFVFVTSLGTRCEVVGEFVVKDFD